MRIRTVFKHVCIVINALFLICNAARAQDIIPAERRIAWDPGIPGGIPSRTTICANVKNSPYNAVGNDIADDTTAIQQAINDCPAGQVVYIPEGRYRLTDGITVNKGIVLRGDSPARTKLKFYRTGPGINLVMGGSGWGTPLNASSGYAKGSTSMVLASVSGLSTGDLAFITQNNDGSFVTNIGAGGACTWCGDNGKGLGQMFRITSVDAGSRTITFEPGLYWTYSAELQPYIRELTSPVQYAGIEDLYVDNVYENPVISIQMNICINCWLKNIESYKGQRHIELDFAYRCEIRESFIHHHHNYVPNHYGILIGSFSTANLIEDNMFYHTKGGTMMVGWGSAGNVFGYNFGYYTFYTGAGALEREITHHGAHPMMNLWEGNIVQAAEGDSYWGSLSHNTFFRNRIRREETVQGKYFTQYFRFGVQIQAMCRYFNVVGNVIGYPGMPADDYELEISDPCAGSRSGVYRLGFPAFTCETSVYPNVDPPVAIHYDPTVKMTLLRHGNYDYMNNTTVWDPNITNHVLPNSYYLSGKPQFFGTVPWPPIGPDISGYTNKIPAQLRFEALMTGQCGNGIIETGEVCDTDSLTGETCHSQNPAFNAGTLTCLPDCSGYDTSQCYACAVADDCEERACNTKSCVSNQCVYTPVANGTSCENGLYCDGTDLCQSGSCTHSGSPCGDDGYTCTTETCNETTDTCGTTYEHAKCDDKNTCTTETCIGSGGNVLTGCSYTYVSAGTICSDGYTCTENDVCNGTGSCQGAPNNAICLLSFSECTTATCNPALYPVMGCGNYQPAGCTDAGLELWLQCNDALTDGIATDSSENKTHGTCTPGTTCPAYLAAGGYSNSGGYDFDGVNDALTVNWAAPIQGDNQSFTIAAWINPSTTSGNHWAVGDDSVWFHFIFGLYNNELYVQWRYTAAYTSYALNTHASIPVNTFSHIAVTYDAQTRYVTVYVNGNQVSQDTTSHPYGIQDIDTVKIGQGYFSNVPEYFDGVIDGVRIYNRALSAVQIQEIMHPTASSSFLLWTR